MHQSDLNEMSMGELLEIDLVIFMYLDNDVNDWLWGFRFWSK